MHHTSFEISTRLLHSYWLLVVLVDQAVVAFFGAVCFYVSQHKTVELIRHLDLQQIRHSIITQFTVLIESVMEVSEAAIRL